MHLACGANAGIRCEKQAMEPAHELGDSRNHVLQSALHKDYVEK